MPTLPLCARRALAMLVAVLPGFAAAATLTLVYSAPYTMSATGGLAQMPLPVSVSSGTDPANVCVEKIGVQFPNMIDSAISDHFDVQKFLVTDKDRVPALRISVKDASTLVPGVYQLSLGLYQCQGGKRGPNLDTFAVPLTRPGVKLEPQGKVVIDRWLSTPWTDQAYRVTPEQIGFRPQADWKSSPLNALHVEPSPFTTGGIGTNVGQWDVGSPVKAAAGDSFHITLKPKAFPIGTASGQITLRSNDLQEPLHFDVDVRTRLASGWIVFVVILGVLAGWLLRVVLQRKIDLATARRPALDQLQRYQSMLAGIPDVTFAEAVAAPLKDLLDAVDLGDAAAITTAESKAKEKVEAARVQLNTKLEAAAAAIDAFRNTFDVNARLPAKFAALRDDAISAAKHCAAMLSPPNPTAATSALGEKQRRVLEGLADARTTLKDQLAFLLEQLALLSPFLEDAERHRLEEKITAIQGSAAAIGAATDLAGAGSLLLGVAQLGRDLGALLEWSARALEFNAPLLGGLIEARTDRNAPGTAQALDAARADLQARMLALAAQVRAQAQLEDIFVAPTWSDAAKVALAAGERALECLAKNRTELPETAASAFRQKIADGNWHAALLGLDPANPRLGGEAPAVLADLVAGSADIAAANTALAAPQVGAFTQPAIAAAKLRNTWQLARAEGMMSIAVAALLGFTSFAVFEDKFIGTWGELLALFFWGFSADLSADKLAEKVAAIGVAPK